MRAVLDTNVLIAAFIANGLCSELLEHCGRQHTLIVSDFLLLEFQEKLVGKFKYTVEEAEVAVRLVQSVAEPVTPVRLASPVCRDVDDDAVLGTAVSGNAACIVTGDSDLLVLKEYRGIAILRPSELIEFEARHTG
jgi:uncharacterized protein